MTQGLRPTSLVLHANADGDHSMPVVPSAADNADQIAFWNGAGGDAWTERQAAQDALLATISAMLVRAAAPLPGERVIDVGCGCGASSFELAAAVGGSGRVLGIDVSRRMLARAAECTPAGARVEFVEADATTHVFDPSGFDLLVSRFGVMFFANPTAAFSNLRRALRPGGRLAFVAWREPKSNPWAMVPLQAAYTHVPRLPPVGPEDPGPFSFASEARVRRILEDAGFTEITLASEAIEIDLAGGRGLDAAVACALEFGPTQLAVAGQRPAARAAVAAAVRDALAAHADGNTVRLPGTFWLVTALNP